MGCGKSSDSLQLLGGAALQRCGKGGVLNPALAAEGTVIKLGYSRPAEDILNQAKSI
jgi:hypothetical protein